MKNKHKAVVATVIGEKEATVAKMNRKARKKAAASKKEKREESVPVEESKCLGMQKAEGMPFLRCAAMGVSAAGLRHWTEERFT